MNTDATHSSHYGFPQFSLRTLIVIVTLVALPLGLIAYVNHRNALRRIELKRLAQKDKITVNTIVEKVEAIRAHLGRAPEDEAELESLLGEPMPVVHDNGYPSPINYQRIGQDSFLLQYELWETDDWIYYSTKPESGWVQHWY